MEQDCLMLFNNVKNSKDSSTIREAFGHAKTRFAAGSSFIDTMKFFYAYKTDQEIRNIVHKVIDQGYHIYIYAVFDDQSLKDGSVAVYYTGLDEDFNEKKTFEESTRSDPGAVGNINDNLFVANLDWEDFKNGGEVVPIVDHLWSQIENHIMHVKYEQRPCIYYKRKKMSSL